MVGMWVGRRWRSWRSEVGFVMGFVGELVRGMGELESVYYHVTSVICLKFFSFFLLFIPYHGVYLSRKSSNTYFFFSLFFLLLLCLALSHVPIVQY